MEKSLTFFFHISFQLLYINSHVSFFFFYCQKVTEKKKPGIEHMYMYRYIYIYYQNWYMQVINLVLHIDLLMLIYFSPIGDIVSLSASSAQQGDEGFGSGIVTHAGKSAISVAFDDKEDLYDLQEEDLYKLTKLANDVTYKRLKKWAVELYISCWWNIKIYFLLGYTD